MGLPGNLNVRAALRPCSPSASEVAMTALCVSVWPGELELASGPQQHLCRARQVRGARASSTRGAPVSPYLYNR